MGLDINIGKRILIYMNSSDLFQLLVNYHYQQNLVGGLEQELNNGNLILREGKIHLNGGREPVTIGFEFNTPWYSNLLLLANGNGDDIVDHLREANILKKRKVPLNFTPVPTPQALFTYFMERKKDSGLTHDGAFIYDGTSHRVTRGFINALDELSESEPTLPNDFLSEDETFKPYSPDGDVNFGSRTNVSVTACHGFTDQSGKDHSLDAYLIKSTTYNSLGLGPAVHFFKDGLEMFYFRLASEGSSGPFVNEGLKIQGVYKKYALQQDDNTGDRYYSKLWEEPVYFKPTGQLVYSQTNQLVFPASTASLPLKEEKRVYPTINNLELALA